MWIPKTSNLLFVGLIAPLMIVTVSARKCDDDKFWSGFFNQCVNCTVCSPPDVIIKECQGHRDTVCGPMSDLHINWSWMKHAGKHKNRADKEMTETFEENKQEIKLHELYVKQKEEKLKKLAEHRQASSESSQEQDDDADDEYDKLLLNLEKRQRNNIPELLPNPFRTEPGKEFHFNSDEVRELLHGAPYNEVDRKLPMDHEILMKPFGFESEPAEAESDTEKPFDVSEQHLDFSTAEQVILDYQTGVLYLAIGSVVFFFAVALWYSLKHIRKWGTRNYAEELEELQYWLLNKKKDLINPGPSTIYKTTTEVLSKETKGNCKYLERLITKNAKKNRVPGIIYMTAQPSMETKPLTLEEPEIHKPVNV